MNGYIKTGSGTWSTIVNLYVKTSSSVWSAVQNAWVKTASGTWSKFYTAILTPAIASPVTISQSSSYTPATLTGTNYHWTDATSLTYKFQKSTDGVSWSDMTGATSISNPGVGLSNTVTYSTTMSDFSTSPQYFRFVVFATNSTYGTNNSSTSSYITEYVPAVSAGSGYFTGTAQQASTMVYFAGTVSNATSQTTYIKRADAFNTVLASTSGSSVGYTLTAADIGYQIYGYTTASNPGGTSTSGAVFSATVTAYPAPTAASGTWSGTTVEGNLLTYSIGATTNASSQTNYIKRADASNTVLATGSGTGSLFYTLTSADVGYQLYAYTVATGIGGTATSSAVFTATITAASSAPTTPGTPTLTYISANGSTSWNYSATFSTSTGTGTITYYLRCYGSSDGYVSQQTLKGPFSSGSTGTFTLPQTSSLWKVAAYAHNSVGDSSDSAKSNAA